MASSTPPPHYPISQSRTHHHHPFNHLQKQPKKYHQKYSSCVSSPSPSPSSSSSSSSSSSPSSTSVSVSAGHHTGSSSICPSSTSQNVHRPGNQGIFSPARPKLGPEFQGNRSTRVVSKRNINRPRWYNANNNHRTPSPSAVDCLNQLIHLRSTEENTMTDMLLSFGVSLSGPDDYGYLVRELGEQGDCSKIVRCFQFGIPRMRDPTERGKLLTAVISSLGRMGRTDLAKEAFDVGFNDGYGKTVYAYSALISAYARSGLSTGALGVFESMKAIGMKPNSVTYNTVIDACVKGGEDLHRTTEVFREMLRNGVRPDRITFNSLLAGCSRAGHWEDARLMYDEMVHLGIGRDVFTYNTFIDAVCKCGNMELAVQIMSEMPGNNLHPNVVTYSTLMDGYSKLERCDEALKLYEEVKALSIPMDRVCFNTLLSIYVKMERYEDVVRTSEEMERLGIDRDVVTYNALMAGYGKQGRFEVVGNLTHKMGVEGIVPNVLTYSTLIDVYSKAGMFEKAMEVYREFRKTGLRSDVVLYSSLIDTLCKNGMVESAVYLLNDMIRVGIRPNVVTYNSVINAFGMSRIQGDDDEGSSSGSNSNELFCILELFRRMQHLGIKPNVVTFSSILNACSHCDSFEDASLLLEQLRSFDNHVYGVAHGLLNGSKEVWRAARVLFDDLKRLDSSTAAAFYNALTDMLWHFGQRRGAQQVVFEGRRRNVWENSWTDSCLDLHLMSSGASQATVYAWLLNIRSVVYEGRELPSLISILTGWGKHSKVSGSSTLRLGVEVLLVSLAAPFHVERFNIGRFVSHGTELAVWLKESCPLSALVLQDDRTQSENGLRQHHHLLPNLQALKL